MKKGLPDNRVDLGHPGTALSCVIFRRRSANFKPAFPRRLGRISRAFSGKPTADRRQRIRPAARGKVQGSLESPGCLSRPSNHNRRAGAQGFFAREPWEHFQHSPKSGSHRRPATPSAWYSRNRSRSATSRRARLKSASHPRTRHVAHDRAELILDAGRSVHSPGHS